MYYDVLKVKVGQSSFRTDEKEGGSHWLWKLVNEDQSPR